MTESEALEMVEVIYMPLDIVNDIECDMVNGFTFKAKDKIFIVINSDKSPEQQEKTLHHELAHIRLHHFDDKRPVEELEKEAEELASQSQN